MSRLAGISQVISDISHLDPRNALAGCFPKSTAQSVLVLVANLGSNQIKRECSNSDGRVADDETTC